MIIEWNGKTIQVNSRNRGKEIIAYPMFGDRLNKKEISELKDYLHFIFLSSKKVKVFNIKKKK